MNPPSLPFRHDGITILTDFWSERVCVPLVSFRHDFWSERVRAPSASFRHDGTTIIIDFFSLFSLLSFSEAITVLPERVVLGF